MEDEEDTIHTCSETAGCLFKINIYKRNRTRLGALPIPTTPEQNIHIKSISDKNHGRSQRNPLPFFMVGTSEEIH